LPKIVNHVQRRRTLLNAVWKVIARNGVEGTTIRDIVQESGFSSGTLAHYFNGKQDLLISALKLSHLGIRARWEANLGDLDGVEAIREFLYDNLPLDEARELETRLEVSFWARSLVKSESLMVQRQEAAEVYGKLVELLERAEASGEVQLKEELSDTAEFLLAAIDGLSIHSLLYPDRLSKDRMRVLMDRLMVLLDIRKGE
jgi:AcrR family transcriptional regulator